MLKKTITLCSLVLALTSSLAFSQKNAIKDSVISDSLHREAENILLQGQYQIQLDSLRKRELEKELEQAKGDNRKTHQIKRELKNFEKSDSFRKSEQSQKIAELKNSLKGFPVLFLNDTLFTIYTKTGSFSARERAKAIGLKIEKLYEDPVFKSDSLKIAASDNSFDVLYEEMFVFSITNLDAIWLNRNGREVAEEYLSITKNKLNAAKKENSTASWLKRIGLIVLIVSGLLLLIFGINKLFKRIPIYFRTNKKIHFNDLVIRNIKILDQLQIRSLLAKIVNVIRLLVIAITIYLSLPLLFSVFPETKGWTDTLLQWILTPAKAAFYAILNFLPNLFTIVVVYFLFRYFLKAIKFFMDEIAKGKISLNGFHQDWAQPTYNIIRFLVYAFMVVVIFPYLPGSGSAAFQGVSVFIGVLFSLGSSSAISNMIAGIVITYMRPFKIGDRVKIGDVTGDVIEKSMLVTRILTIKNEEITLSNSSVLTGNTINYSSNTKPEDTGLIMHTTVTIGYDVPWQNMYDALINAAGRTQYLLKDPKPFVLQTSLDDFYVSYQINAYTKEANKQALIYSTLHQNIQDCCNEVGIEILSPHYRAARDGNMSTIPHSYLPPDYKAPAFNVSSNTS